MTTVKQPETLQEAIVYFSDPERAFRVRGQPSLAGSARSTALVVAGQAFFIKTRRLWFCKGCKKQFTVKVGTIFEDCRIGLDKWMTAVWMVVNCKNGVSSYEIQRTLSASRQKSAWFMLHRIREALAKRSFGDGKIGGPGKEVESDETFIGGKSPRTCTRPAR